MKKNLLALVLILAISEIVKSQTDFRPGYIIQLNGDTLFGEVDYRGDLLMCRKCKFRVTDTDSEREYGPSEIQAYRFENSKYFVSKKVSDATYFMEFLIKGKICIYYLRDEIKDHYYLEKEGMDMVEIPYEEGIKYVESPGTSIPSAHYYATNKHIGLLKVYMQDAKNFDARIERIKKPDHNSLIKLAEDYHNNVCSDESCIIFEKETPLIRINPELLVGVVNYANVNDVYDKNYFMGGLILNLWLPRRNEKFFFRTGLVASQIILEDEKGYFMKIPIQLEYQYPGKIIRPRISAGVNFYPPIYQTVAIEGGLNIKLYRSFYLAVNSGVDFEPSNFPLWPQKLFSYSLLSGLYLAF